MTQPSSFSARALQTMGIKPLPEGTPLGKGRGLLSRYSVGFVVSRRLDEDIDGLRQEVARLKEQIEAYRK